MLGVEVSGYQGVPDRYYKEEYRNRSMEQDPSVQPVMHMNLEINPALVIAKFLHLIDHGMDIHRVFQPGEPKKII